MISTIDAIEARPVTLADLEQRTGAYDKACAQLETTIAELEADLEAVKRKYLAGLKRQASIVAGAEAELHCAIECAPGLFKKPKTLIINGVKVGFGISQGKLVFDEQDEVLHLIKKYRKDDKDILIRTSEELNKDALRALTATDLAKLGCRIDGAGDVVVLKRVAGDVEKLVNNMIHKLVEAMTGKD
jgi:hypothetical protein